ncbi:uncharacterized protein LOC128165586 isoform X2 [Crassostrea angulata]|uniref:uncharacterized protein LOC128165586 isoform X2 n=1 Tax=Magallana angulata TaxID=2784310 RepID=UPI0022B18867|nr:uncharacterized protein LOC128165586 isoform X2 [Crassostrea angulata]
MMDDYRIKVKTISPKTTPHPSWTGYIITIACPSKLINSRRGDRRYWKCVIPDCAARLNTHHEFITKFVHRHNHEPDAVDVKVRRIMEKIKQKQRRDQTSASNLRGRTMPSPIRGVHRI